MPSISVLMPVYNAAEYLREAIASVVGQSFGDWELIVIDDGSSDGSAALAATLAAEDARIRCIRRENRGVIATRNELVAEARGRYVAWMDSDDIAASDRLARQIDFLDRHGDHVCVGSMARQIDPAGRRLGVERYPTDDAAIRDEQRYGGGLRFPTTLMRLDAMRKVGPFREPFRIGEDFDFLLRVGEQGRLANIDEELYLYRQHPSSAVAMLGDYWQLYRDAILTLAKDRAASGKDSLQRGETLHLPVAKRSLSRARSAQVYRAWADAVFAEGRAADGFRYLGMALRAAPLDVATWKRTVKAILRKDPRVSARPQG